MNNLDVTKKERLAVFDVAKGLGILLVVFAHVNYTPESLIYIYSFHMPLFFLISGIFFNNKKYTFCQFLKSRFLRLICPYLFFYTALLCASSAVKFILMDFSLSAIGTYKNAFIQMFIAQGSSSVISAPLWFVPCLFAVEIIYYFISKLKVRFIIPVCAILVLGGWMLETNFTQVAAYLPWSLDSALFSLGFYAIGNLSCGFLKNIIKKIKESKYRSLISLSIALLCFAVVIPFAFLNGKVSLGSKILNNGFLFYLTGIAGSAGVIFLSLAIINCKFLQFLGKNTFCIMATHYFIDAYLKKVILKFVFTDYDNTKILHTILPFVIVLSLSIICVFVYNYLKSIIFKKKTA